ncbi:MAG: C40 family peptidase [Deltaproteobacteria bacterium]|nr:C40 family peptidase [Deltaproteobacteria bacterium]
MKRGDAEARREVALRVAWAFLGRPYIWGGDDPMAGFDCSGFVIEILKSVGLFPRRADTTAHGLHAMFSRAGMGKVVPRDPYAGCLVFWQAEGSDRIRHVEMMINESLSIGASGGGSRTRSRQDAIRENAYIKVRPVDFQDPDLYGFVDPF